CSRLPRGVVVVSGDYSYFDHW
nr:immunoglobulin heavy chain junction region [Macaca mulatta]